MTRRKVGAIICITALFLSCWSVWLHLPSSNRGGDTVAESPIRIEHLARGAAPGHSTYIKESFKQLPLKSFSNGQFLHNQVSYDREARIKGRVLKILDRHGLLPPSQYDSYIECHQKSCESKRYIEDPASSDISYVMKDLQSDQFDKYSKEYGIEVYTWKFGWDYKFQKNYVILQMNVSDK